MPVGKQGVEKRWFENSNDITKYCAGNKGHLLAIAKKILKKVQQTRLWVGGEVCLAFAAGNGVRYQRLGIGRMGSMGGVRPNRVVAGSAGRRRPNFGRLRFLRAVLEQYLLAAKCSNRNGL